MGTTCGREKKDVSHPNHPTEAAILIGEHLNLQAKSAHISCVRASVWRDCVLWGHLGLAYVIKQSHSREQDNSNSTQ